MYTKTQEDECVTENAKIMTNNAQ